MSALREALARKRRRETFYDLEVDDATAARERHETARQALRLAKLRGDTAEAEQAELDEARAQWALCVYRIRFQNLPPDEYEALVATHPPTKEQETAGDPWNRTTFAPALIAACAVDSDLTEDEWAAELRSERWPITDRDAAFLQALAANLEARSATIPKG